jgi:hypothetical protein
MLAFLSGAALTIGRGLSMTVRCGYGSLAVVLV